jgi:carbon-monoxide dehydrogenase medium subunit
VSLPKFTYLAPTSLEEACGLLVQYQGKIRTKAGGTDLMVRLAQRALNPEYIMGIKKIPELATISFNPDEGLRLGAMVLLSEVADNPIILEHYPMLARAARSTATVQIRNMGTVMGNICNASPSADNSPTLVAMNARIVAVSSAGERQIPIDEFFLGPGRSALEPTEIAREILVPTPSPRSGVSYQKISPRSKVDIAAVNVGAMVVVDEQGACRQARICLGAVGPVPLRAASAEEFLLGKTITDAVAEEAGALAGSDASPISDVRASKEYRRLMVVILTKRALLEARHGTGI